MRRKGKGGRTIESIRCRERIVSCLIGLAGLAVCFLVMPWLLMIAYLCCGISYFLLRDGFPLLAAGGMIVCIVLRLWKDRQWMSTKRKRRLMKLTVMLCICALFLQGRTGEPPPFDEITEGLICVETISVYKDKEKKQYYVLAAGCRSQETEAMGMDDMQVWHIPLDRHGTDQLEADVLTDDEGNEWPIDGEITEIVNAINRLDDHGTTANDLVIADEEWFVYRELNVNLWSPCELYYYNREEKKMVELYTFNGEVTTGIQVLQREKLHQLR